MTLCEGIHRCIYLTHVLSLDKCCWTNSHITDNFTRKNVRAISRLPCSRIPSHWHRFSYAALKTRVDVLLFVGNSWWQKQPVDNCPIILNPTRYNNKLKCSCFIQKRWHLLEAETLISIWKWLSIFVFYHKSRSWNRTRIFYVFYTQCGMSHTGHCCNY